MKKGFLWRVAAALMAAVVSVGLMSCGGEPTSGPGPGPEPTISLVGTWKWEVGNGNYNLLTFRQDGTGDDIIVKNGHTHSFPFSYTYSDGVVTMHYSNEYAPGDGSFRVMSLTSTKLVLEGWGDDGEDVIFIKQEDTPPITISLVGTWTGLLGDEGYYTCTFTGNETNGTLKVEINEKGNLEVESFSYTYTGGYLVLSGNNFSKTVQVISLTATTLVLKDFPDDDICTMTKRNGQQNSSLVGTWTGLLGDEGYYTCTFTGNETNGTLKVEINEKGNLEVESFSYVYTGGYLVLSGNNFFEMVQVISLTATTLVLKDFPDDGICTMTKRNGQQNSSLVGTWKYTFDGGYDLLTFRQDGTGTYSQFENGRWDDGPQSLTYTYSNGVLRIFLEHDGEETCRVRSLTSTTLVLEGWDDEDATFIRQQ